MSCPRVTLLLVLAFTSASQPIRAQATAAEQAVRQVEDRRIKALIADDFATLEAILADDLTYTHSSALVDTKASYLETLRSGKTKYESFDRTPSTVRIYGETALVTGGATIGLRGQSTKIVVRYTLAYVRQAGQWRMVAWQSTRLPNPTPNP